MVNEHLYHPKQPFRYKIELAVFLCYIIDINHFPCKFLVSSIKPTPLIYVSGQCIRRKTTNE
jgi:hypothetical protein